MTTAQWQVVQEGHQSAGQTGATRNPSAERGEGRAFRHEPNMTPVLKSNMVKRSNRIWGQSNAVEVKKDLTGKPGALTVAVRSANTNPAAVGVSTPNWGIAGFGDDAPATAPPSNTNLYLIGGAAVLAALLLFRK